MQVLAVISAPAELSHNFTKANLRRKDVYLMGVNWETANYICENPECRHVIDGYGNYVTNLEKERENVRTLLADHVEREAALRAEVERLKAAIDTQPSPPTREDMEWAGKVHLAKAEKENDALRAEVEALRRTATDRAGIIDSVREWTRGVVNDNWALRAEVEALRAALEPFAGAEPEYSAGGLYTILVNGRDLTAARAALAQAKDAEAQ